MTDRFNVGRLESSVSPYLVVRSWLIPQYMAMVRSQNSKNERKIRFVSQPGQEPFIMSDHTYSTKLLLVDDDANVRSAKRRILGLEPMPFATASNNLT